MNKIKLLYILFFFCGAAFAQNPDTSRAAPPPPAKADTIKTGETPAISPPQNQNTTSDPVKTDTNKDKQDQPVQTNTVTPEPKNKKRPKGYDDYINKGKRPTVAPPFMDNVYYGANLQIGYGASSYGSALSYDISPHAGYKFGEVFSIGVQVIYKNTVYTFGNTKINYNIFGGGVFGRALLGNRFFLQAEVDELSIPANYLGTTITSRQPCIEKMIGAGYKSMLGQKLSYFLIILFDINPELYSPYYGNQLIPRAGIVYNF